MAVNTQVIEIVTRFVDGASQKVKEVTQRVEDLRGGYQRVTTTLSTLNKNTGKLNKSMETQRVVAKRFQMQWLSIMFFGMALNRVFNGLIKTSMEWVGITELMSLTMGVFFLPIALALLDILLPILQWFMDAPEPIKLVVGGFVLLGGAVSGVLMVVGQLALGLAGLSWLSAAGGMGNVGTAAEGAATKVGLLKSALGKTIAVAVGITIAWAGFEFIKSGIEKGSLLKEIMGVLTMGIGLGVIGLTFGGVVGGAIGFTLGISIGLIVDWFIKKDKKITDVTDKIQKDLEEAGAPQEYINQVTANTAAGMSGKPLPYLQPSATPQAPSPQSVPKKNSINMFGVDIPLPSWLPKFEEGGIVPGTIGSPVPILAHAGERVIPVGGGSNGSVTVNATYYVTVSDKKEFETLLRENNIRLTEDVRRIVKT